MCYVGSNPTERTEQNVNVMEQNEMNEKIKNLVIGTTAKFAYYRNGFMYYEIKARDGFTYSFPIEVTSDGDIGNATLNNKEKGATLMRYIRKAIKNEQLIKVN